MDIVTIIAFIIIVTISVFIFKRRWRTKQETVDRRMSNLAADLRAGGAGMVGVGGRVEGEVGVYILGDTASAGCAGVMVR